MEVILKVSTTLGQVVDQSALLYKVVFLVNANVLNLLLGLTKVDGLLLLNNIGPLGSELLKLVTRVGVVENSKFGSGQPGKVAHLNVTQVEGNQELVVENHTTDPLVVGPATKTRDGADGGDVGEHHDNAATGAGKGLVVGGDLFGADSLVEGLHETVVREDEGIGLSVVRVDVALVSGLKLVRVVGLAIHSFVFRLGTAQCEKRYQETRL